MKKWHLTLSEVDLISSSRWCVQNAPLQKAWPSPTHPLYVSAATSPKGTKIPTLTRLKSLFAQVPCAVCLFVFKDGPCLRSGHLFSFPSFHCSVVSVQVSLGSKILSARGSALPALQSLGLGATVPSPLMSGSVGWVLNLLRCHWKCSSASARSYISTHQPCCCPLCCSSPQGTQHRLSFLHSSSEL